MTARIAIAVAVLASAHPGLADPTSDAAQLYRDGQTAFDQARYDDALAAWQQSYALSHEPGLLLDIAQAYRLRAHPGDCAEARAQFQRFFQVSPPTPQTPLAESYITQLAACATPPASGDRPV